MGSSMMNGSNLQETDGAFGDLHRIRRRTLVVVLCGAVLAALVMAAVLWAPGVNRSLRHKRGLGFAQAARQAMTNGKWEEAGPYVKAALELAPDDLTVLRIAAELCEHAGYIEAVHFRKMATYAPGATRDDRLKFARTALDFQAYEVGGRQFDPLLAEMPGDTETRVRPTSGDPLRIRIIAVCVFGATGQRQVAVALAKSLPASRLWLCERALIQTWLW